MLRLRLLPHAVLHNLSPLPLGLLAHPPPDNLPPQRVRLRVSPRSSMALDWGPGNPRPRRAVLVAWAAGGLGAPVKPGCKGVSDGACRVLRSEPFVLERAAAPQLLELRAPTDAGGRVTLLREACTLAELA